MKSVVPPELIIIFIGPSSTSTETLVGNNSGVSLVVVWRYPSSVVDSSEGDVLVMAINCCLLQC